MQELHLVGFTTDLEALIFSTRKGAKSGSYVVSLDSEVIGKIEEALRLRSGGDGAADARRVRSLAALATPRQESSLTPKQMQAKLRIGRSVAEVAREAGVDTDWVARFAAPILAEQAQIIGETRQRLMTKPRLGASSQPLDTAVKWNLGDRGIYLEEDEYEEGWGARNLRDTLWLVSFQYVSRKREQRAEWELEHTSSRLTPKNRLASDLGYVEPGRRRGPIPPRPMPVSPTRVLTQQPAPPVEKPPAAVKLTPAQKKAAAKKVAAEKAAAKKAAAKQAAAEREAAKKQAKRVALQRAAAKRAAIKQAAAAKKTAARLAAAKKAAAERAEREARARARAAKKAAAEKEAAKKAAARKAAAKKSIPRKKAAAKKAATKKAAAKTALAKKASAKKVASRKAAAKKAATRRPAPKKTAARKPAVKKAVKKVVKKSRPRVVAKKTVRPAPKKVAAKKVTAKKAPSVRKAPARPAPRRVATPVVRQAPAAAALRAVPSSSSGEVARSAAAAYLEARRRGPEQPAPARPAATRQASTPLRPVSGGAPPVVIRAAPASAGPVEPEPTLVIGNGAEPEEAEGRGSRLRRRRPLRGRSS
ncbi:MAG TPA: septation protein SepH [Acidimicrobiales bacterium]|nr:septation protein SepH [Acidimicrobiales bacterium]